MSTYVPVEIADRLYALPPEEFVAARNAEVETAREAEDRAGAAAIAKLRKPTVAAWLVNLLALRRPELVAELVDLAAQLRSAQRELRGDELRELSSRRRAAIAALVGQARALAVAAQPGLAGVKLPVADVEATLTAALSEEEVAAQVRSGRLVRAIAYAGFGEVPRPRLRLVTEVETAPRAAVDADYGSRAVSPSEAAEPGAAATGPVKAGVAKAGSARKTGDAKKTGGAKTGQPEQAAEPAVTIAGGAKSRGRRAESAQQAELERLIAEARTEERTALAELDRAAAAERDGARSLAAADAAVAEAQRGRVAAEAELSRRKLAHKAAQRAVSAARRRLGEVQGALESVAGYQDAETGSVRHGQVGNYTDQPNGGIKRSAG
jgi:hypothetical protein